MVKFWKNRKLLLFLPLFVAIVALFLFGINWQSISDTERARAYQPSGEIAAIVSDLKLTSKGETIFYASQPQLQTAEQISDHCGNSLRGHTLGCYDYNRGGSIYLRNIATDAIDEHGLYFDFRAYRNETALHELLHAAYERLSLSDKNMVCESAHYITDGKLVKKLSSYPEDQYCTEAFARIGSEYIDLADDNLRSIYSRFFAIDTDFYAINAQNNRNLTNYSAEISRLSTELKTKKQSIDQMREDYSISPTWQKMNTANSIVSEYNLLLKEYRQKLETYNKIVAAI